MSQQLKGNPSRRAEPGAGLNTPWVIAGVVLLILLLVFGLVLVAGTVGGASMPDGPLGYVAGLAAGSSPWTVAATVVLVVGLVIILGFSAGVGWLWWKASHQKSPVDQKAQSMASRGHMASLLEKRAARDRDRLGVPAEVGMGTPIGDLVSGDGRYSPMWSSYEWVQIWVLGPRAGKTSCVAVRQIIEHKGPVLATSNKRDIVDLSRGSRLGLGFCWVFDPQGLIGEKPTWWWNPLSTVQDTEQADELAGLFASSAASDKATPDAYFEPEAQNHLSNLLLAAAVSEQPITMVWKWLAEPKLPDPTDILFTAGFEVAGEGVEKIASLPDAQRDGVIGTARKMCGWLRNPKTLRWITKTGPDDDRPEFDPAEFVKTRQTLYLISREGAGSARAVTAALAVATMRAGEHAASRSPGGRLPVPLAVVLDEAANVVRWRDLPDMYSHYGSRGIVLSTFFQSWAQGTLAYGAEGMEKLWSASNIRVVGSGIAEEGFLQKMVSLIGRHDEVSINTSTGPASGRDFLAGRTSVSRQLRREDIFEVSELAGMPPGRAIMLAAGMPAALVKLRHYSETDYANAVRESEKTFGDLAVRPDASVEAAQTS